MRRFGLDLPRRGASHIRERERWHDEAMPHSLPPLVNRWWTTRRGDLLDAGAFVAGLEYASGVQAEVIGKPTRAYFEAALAALGASAGETTMVGDDVEADVGGAKALGLRAVLVCTGKFKETTLTTAEPQPDAVIDSIADLPALLERE